jgi:hypothetical protein
MFEWHKKEAPVFTGIARGVGGFGFGKSVSATSSGAISLLQWGSTSPSSVSWTLTNTLSSQGETLIQPASQYNVAKLLIWGGGGSASFDSGGNGGAGGYTEVYFTLSPILRNFLAVVGGAGAQAQNATAYTRLQEDGSPYNAYGPRSFGNGGPPTTQAMGGGAQFWGGGGGGLSGVFWADSVLTSTNGSKFFYCTPIAIAGGGGGGSSYNRNAHGGGLRSTLPTPEDLTYTRGTDAQSTSQFANVRYGSNTNLYLRSNEGNTGGGYVGGYWDGGANRGGASFVWSSSSIPPTGVGVESTRSLLNSFSGFIHSSSYATTEAQTGITQTPYVTTNRPGSAGQGGSANGGLGTSGAILVYMGTI